MKICKKCGIEKDVSQFSKRSHGSKDGLQAYCKNCLAISASREPYVFEYGITQGDYDELYKLQDGKCVICQERKEKLYVDHDHSTGRIRELLCNKCNAGLGYFKDNKNRIKNAYNYLRKHEDINDVKNLLQEFPNNSYSMRRSAKSSTEPERTQ